MPCYPHEETAQGQEKTHEEGQAAVAHKLDACEGNSVYYSRKRKIKWSFYNEDRLVGSSAGFSSLALSNIRFTSELALIGASCISGCAYFSPLKLFEYMAAGRAVVASRVGQVAEVVVDGVTLADLASCIRRLRNNAALRKELGRNANAACSERTWTHNAAKVLDQVEPLIKQNRAWPRRAIGFGNSRVGN